MQKKFLAAEWQNLIMANYIVDPAVLSAYLPAKTELDFYNGHAYLSLVGFMFAETSLFGIKIPFHINFEEVNLRFYVRYNDKGNWKRGVVFIKEIVPKHAISFIANTVYREKYCRMPMRNFKRNKDSEIQVGYHWKSKTQWNKLEVTVKDVSVPMLPGSEEAFIAEHYWGYSRYNACKTFEYAVQHPAWEIYPVTSYLVDCDFEDLYGKEFAFLQTTKPASFLLAKGSAIAVLQKTTL
jgi:uncharacterized protein